KAQTERTSKRLDEEHGIARSPGSICRSRRILRWTWTDSRHTNSNHCLSLRTLDAIHNLAVGNEDQEEIRGRLGGRHNAPPSSSRACILGRLNLLDRPSNRTVTRPPWLVRRPQPLRDSRTAKISRKQYGWPGRQLSR